MLQSFVPANQLEEKLLAFYRRQITFDDFWQFFIAAQIIVLLDQPIDETKANKNMNPLIVIPDQRGFHAVALFTSLERTKPVIVRFPQYQYALQTDCGWLLQGIQPTAGIAVDLECECGFALPPDGLVTLKQLSRIGTPLPPTAE